MSRESDALILDCDHCNGATVVGSPPPPGATLYYDPKKPALALSDLTCMWCSKPFNVPALANIPQVTDASA